MYDKKRTAAAPKGCKKKRPVRRTKSANGNKVYRYQSKRVKHAFAENRAEQEQYSKCNGIRSIDPRAILGQLMMQL